MRIAHRPLTDTLTCRLLRFAIELKHAAQWGSVVRQIVDFSTNGSSPRESNSTTTIGTAGPSRRDGIRPRNRGGKKAFANGGATLS